VGKILLAGEEPQEWTPLLRDMISNGSTKHRIAGLNSVYEGTLRNRAVDLNINLNAHMRQSPQMLRKHDSYLPGTHLIDLSLKSNFTIVTNAASSARPALESVLART
jgi:hypothetical protein